MAEPSGFEKHLRVTIVVTLLVLVVVAPLVGVYTFSPFFFAWGIDPYQLAVALSVMLAEALAVGLLYLLVLRAHR